MIRTIENIIEIQRAPAQVFDYVTRPAKWHEWYPSSKESDLEDRVMLLGEDFSFVTIQKPFRVLPYRFEKTIDWTVKEYEEASVWRIVSASSSLNIDTQYSLSQTDTGTRFVRRSNYETKGVLKLVEPFGIRKSLVEHAGLAMDNLKSVIERDI